MANTGTVTLTSGTSSIGYGAIPPLTVGQVYTSTGTGTASWTTPSTQFNNSNGKPIMSVPAGTDEIVLEKDATLTVKGRMVINGVDLEERLKTIEKVLMIPERDVKLEEKHPKLKKMYYDYINELAKYRMWQAIKGTDE
jgi:hypothetical protein